MHGFTPVNKYVDATSPSSSYESTFVVGNPFLTLICLDDHTTSLALIRSTSIHGNGVLRTDVNIKTLQAGGSKVKVSSSVLVLVPSHTETNLTWVWNGGYFKMVSSVPGLNTVNQKVVEVSVLGSLIELVNPKVVDASGHLSAEMMMEINMRSLTWSLENEVLEAAIDLIWKRSLEMNMPVSSLTSLRINTTMSTHFPYCFKDGKYFFLTRSPTIYSFNFRFSCAHL